MSISSELHTTVVHNFHVQRLVTEDTKNSKANEYSCKDN